MYRRKTTRRGSFIGQEMDADLSSFPGEEAHPAVGLLTRFRDEDSTVGFVTGNIVPNQ